MSKKWGKTVSKRLKAIDQKKVIAVDLNGTLASGRGPDPAAWGEPQSGAKEAMAKLKEAGYKLIINSVVGDVDAIDGWLTEHGLREYFDEINESPAQPDGASGKLNAQAYLDDRAVQYTGDWDETLQNLFDSGILEKHMGASIVNRMVGSGSYTGPEGPYKSLWGSDRFIIRAPYPYPKGDITYGWVLSGAQPNTLTPCGSLRDARAEMERNGYSLAEKSMSPVTKRLAKGQYLEGDDDNSIWVMTTGDVDRDGETVDPEGGDLTEFSANPVVIDNHDTDAGVTEAVLGRVTRYWNEEVGEGTKWPAVGGDKRMALLGEIKWNTATQKGKDAAQMAKDGMLNGGSISFVPLDNPGKNHGGGNHYSKWKLLEFTVCPVGSNPSAVRLKRFKSKEVEKGWKEFLAGVGIALGGVAATVYSNPQILSKLQSLFESGKDPKAAAEEIEPQLAFLRPGRLADQTIRQLRDLRFSNYDIGRMSAQEAWSAIHDGNIGRRSLNKTIQKNWTVWVGAVAVALGITSAALLALGLRRNSPGSQILTDLFEASATPAQAAAKLKPYVMQDGITISGRAELLGRMGYRDSNIQYRSINKGWTDWALLVASLLGVSAGPLLVGRVAAFLLEKFQRGMAARDAAQILASRMPEVVRSMKSRAKRRKAGKMEKMTPDESDYNDDVVDKLTEEFRAGKITYEQAVERYMREGKLVGPNMAANELGWMKKSTESIASEVAEKATDENAIEEAMNDLDVDDNMKAAVKSIAKRLMKAVEVGDRAYDGKRWVDVREIDGNMATVIDDNGSIIHVAVGALRKTKAIDKGFKEWATVVAGVLRVGLTWFLSNQKLQGSLQEMHDNGKTPQQAAQDIKPELAAHGGGGVGPYGQQMSLDPVERVTDIAEDKIVDGDDTEAAIDEAMDEEDVPVEMRKAVRRKALAHVKSLEGWISLVDKLLQAAKNPLVQMVAGHIYGVIKDKLTAMYKEGDTPQEAVKEIAASPASFGIAGQRLKAVDQPHPFGKWVRIVDTLLKWSHDPTVKEMAGRVESFVGQKLHQWFDRGDAPPEAVKEIENLQASKSLAGVDAYTEQASNGKWYVFEDDTPLRGPFGNEDQAIEVMETDKGAKMRRKRKCWINKRTKSVWLLKSEGDPLTPEEEEQLVDMGADEAVVEDEAPVDEAFVEEELGTEEKGKNADKVEGIAEDVADRAEEIVLAGAEDGAAISAAMVEGCVPLELQPEVKRMARKRMGRKRKSQEFKVEHDEDGWMVVKWATGEEIAGPFQSESEAWDKVEALGGNKSFKRYRKSNGPVGLAALKNLIKAMEEAKNTLHKSEQPHVIDAIEDALKRFKNTMRRAYKDSGEEDPEALRKGMRFKHRGKSYKCKAVDEDTVKADEVNKFDPSSVIAPSKWFGKIDETNELKGPFDSKDEAKKAGPGSCQYCGWDQLQDGAQCPNCVEVKKRLKRKRLSKADTDVVTDAVETLEAMEGAGDTPKHHKGTLRKMVEDLKGLSKTPEISEDGEVPDEVMQRVEASMKKLDGHKKNLDAALFRVSGRHIFN